MKLVFPHIYLPNFCFHPNIFKQSHPIKTHPAIAIYQCNGWNVTQSECYTRLLENIYCNFSTASYRYGEEKTLPIDKKMNRTKTDSTVLKLICKVSLVNVQNILSSIELMEF